MILLDLILEENLNHQIYFYEFLILLDCFSLFFSLKSNLLESLLNPKNKEVFYMEKNSKLYFNIPQGVKSLVHINVVSGKGKIGYEEDEQSIQEISGKYSSMYLQSTENR